jgi:cell wall-associated NlpC family hydrolase
MSSLIGMTKAGAMAHESLAVSVRGHTGWVRRALLVVTLSAVAVAAGAWLAIGAAGSDGRPPARTAPAPAARTVGHKADSGLPPLPAMRGTVVEPKAGAASAGAPASSTKSAPRDPGLDNAGPAPTAPATTGGRAVGSIAGHGSVHDATALPNGIAVPPLEAPDAVRRMIEAGNVIARAPYIWGGGHGKWIDKGYDCSGSVSFVLAAAGYLDGPLDSGHLAQWGAPGPGRWVTIYANAGHVFMEVAGIRFDTVARAVTGSRWANGGRSTAGFAVRHPPGL